MTYIKKLYIEGFKSFAKPTEVVFEKGMNVIVGANGAGKSNLIDAICFVLGRLRAHSLRATKAAKLIYNGGKKGKPAQQAKVSIVFDNSERIFSLPFPEIEIARIIKKDGSSIYKINGETKTRQEVLELLAQAAIDPEGFNIILQNEIAGIVEMRSEEKRELIEEIAGISIYEERKEKALRELEKTEEKLKTVKTILNERGTYMRNLQHEKEQAEKYENLKKAIRQEKASLIWKNAEKRKKLLKNINKEIEQKENTIGKIKSKIEEFKQKIEECKARIAKIDESIVKKTGIAQEKLRENILSLKTQLSSLNLKKENFSDQINSITVRRAQLNKTLKRLEQEVMELEKAKEKAKASGSDKKEEQKKREREKIKREIENIKDRLIEIENRKHQFYILQSEIGKKEALVSEKEDYLLVHSKEIVEMQKEINELKALSSRHFDENMALLIEKKNQNSVLQQKLMKELEAIEKEIISLTAKKEIHKRDFENILSFDKCPTCKQLISEKHKNSIMEEFEKEIFALESSLQFKRKEKEKVTEELKKIVEIVEKTIEKIRALESANETRAELQKKEDALKKLINKKEALEQEIITLKSQIAKLKKRILRPEFIETEYAENKTKLEALEEKLLKIKMDRYEFSDKDSELEIRAKTNEMEKIKAIIKGIDKEKAQFEMKVRMLRDEIALKEKELEKREKEQTRIELEFKSFLEKKQKLQDESYEYETKINELQTKKLKAEAEINEIKIKRAKIDAEIETLELELKEFPDIEIVKDVTIEELERKLEKNEAEFQKLGAVNLRALEVYDKIKAEYDEIASRVAKLEEEKQEILKIISEIEGKKKRAFMQTFNALNESFSSNFRALDGKGRESFLELENKEEPFAGGVDIIIKLAKGKYMDIDSLSGGEKVITALALLFAIQKHRPHCFYIFDEIDPALDKRNSERFASLLKENIKESQGIIITHNDSVINQADTLYGATMQDGISKIISLKV